MLRNPSFIFRALAFLAVTASIVLPASAFSDNQVWNTVSMPLQKTRMGVLKLNGEMRAMDNAGRLGYWSTSMDYVWHWRRGISLVAGYKYEGVRNAGVPDSWKSGWFFDFSPSVKLSRGWKWSMRNRFDIRRLKNKTGWHERMRHRSMFSVPLGDSGLFKSYFISDEVFYDVGGHRISENRFVPIGFGIRLSGRTGLSAGLQIRSIHHAGSWEQVGVLLLGWKLPVF